MKWAEETALRSLGPRGEPAAWLGTCPSPILSPTSTGPRSAQRLRCGRGGRLGLCRSFRKPAHPPSCCRTCRTSPAATGAAPPSTGTSTASAPRIACTAAPGPCGLAVSQPLGRERPETKRQGPQKPLCRSRCQQAGDTRNYMSSCEALCALDSVMHQSQAWRCLELLLLFFTQAAAEIESRAVLLAILVSLSFGFSAQRCTSFWLRFMFL